MHPTIRWLDMLPSTGRLICIFWRFDLVLVLNVWNLRNCCSRRLCHSCHCPPLTPLSPDSVFFSFGLCFSLAAAHLVIITVDHLHVDKDVVLLIYIINNNCIWTLFLSLCFVLKQLDYSLLWYQPFNIWPWMYHGSSTHWFIWQIMAKFCYCQPAIWKATFDVGRWCCERPSILVNNNKPIRYLHMTRHQLPSLQKGLSYRLIPHSTI